MSTEESKSTDDQQGSEEKEKMTVGRFLVKEVMPIAIVILVLIVFRSIILDWNHVPTGSMRPTILEGDRIAVNKAAFGLRVPFTWTYLTHWDEPARGDIIIFQSPEEPELLLVKRVVAVPGDTIEVRNHRIILNGEPLEYVPVDVNDLDDQIDDERLSMDWFIEKLPGADHLVAIPKDGGDSDLTHMDEITVGPGEYFVMGDNRDRSKDSRAFNKSTPKGTISLGRILGRSSRLIMSIEPKTWVGFRGSRFFKGLDSQSEVAEEKAE